MEDYGVLSNLDVLRAVSKGMWAVKLCSFFDKSRH